MDEKDGGSKLLKEYKCSFDAQKCAAPVQDGISENGSPCRSAEVFSIMRPLVSNILRLTIVLLPNSLDLV